ncbi:MAG: hypothetical protein QXL17_04100, partial [Candidatus Thermoplasmatota archaeon]
LNGTVSNGATTRFIKTNFTMSNNNLTLAIIVPVNISNNGRVWINITKGITNPTTVGLYKLMINTSKELTSIYSENYTIVPAAPTSFTATTVSSTQINLAWTKGTGASHTRIQRKTGSYPTSISDGTNVYNGTGSSYSDTGLSSSTTYYYRAWSWDNSNLLWSIESASASATTSASSGGGDSPPPSGPSEVRITVSTTAMNEINTRFGVSLVLSFYARDTNGDGRVDTLVDPNGVLTEVQDTILDGHVIMLVSTNKDNKPEFFWDTAANTITPVTYQQGTAQETIVDTTKETITVIVNIEKTDWVYIDITDQYPPDQYPDYTLIVKTADGRVISSDMIWRQNGRIYILDDPDTTYKIIYGYNILPPTFNPPAGTTFDSSFNPPDGYEFDIRRPMITITYSEAVTIVSATLNNLDVRHMFKTVDNKVFTFEPTYDLSNGPYTLSLTVQDADGHRRTDTATYTINAPAKPSEPVGFPLWLIILIVVIIVILLIVVVLFKTGRLYVEKTPKEGAPKEGDKPKKP